MMDNLVTDPVQNEGVAATVKTPASPTIKPSGGIVTTTPEFKREGN
jgi:hypothetical protein